MLHLVRQVVWHPHVLTRTHKHTFARTCATMDSPPTPATSCHARHGPMPCPFSTPVGTLPAMRARLMPTATTTTAEIAANRGCGMTPAIMTCATTGTWDGWVGGGKGGHMRGHEPGDHDT